MLPDPIVEEVRRVRKAIVAECGSDPKKLFEFYLKVQAESGARVVNLEAKPAKKLRKAG